MDDERGSLEASRGKTPVQGWGPRTQGQKSKSEQGSAQEGFEVAHALVPAAPGRRDAVPSTEHRVPSGVSAGAGRAHVTGWGRAMVRASCRLALLWPQMCPIHSGQRELRTLRPLPHRRSHSEPNQYRRGTPGFPAVQSVWGRLLFFPKRPRCQARVCRGQRSFPVPLGASERGDGGTPRNVPATSEQGAAGRRGPVRPPGSGLASPGRAERGARCPAGLGAAGRPGRQAGRGPWPLLVTRRWTRCWAGPPAGRPRAGPWAPGGGRWAGPPWAGSPAGSRGCPG